MKIKDKKINLAKKIYFGIGTLIIISILFTASNLLTKEVVFKGCGTELINYEYSLRFPIFWTIKQTINDSASSYYEVKGINNVFTASCTNQGVGGGCEDKYRSRIKIAGTEYNACFGKYDNKWNLSNLNLPTEKNTNATISFWATGLNKARVEKILSTFKVDQTKNINSIASESYKYGISYVDSTYGLKIDFPADIIKFKSKEYKWSNHKNVYNPIFEKTFASDINKFNYETGNFYQNYNNPQTLGNLISYQVYDIKNCNDVSFCNKYVYTTETSGIIIDGYKPYTYWMRNDNYLFMFGIVNDDVKSANSKYKLSFQ